MKRSEASVGKAPIKARLHSVAGLPGQQVRFPMHDPSYAGQELPTLVVVRSRHSGRQEIAGTGWWGTPETNEALTAVEASPGLVKAMAGKDASAADGRVLIRRARWWDVAIYAHGFWAPVAFALFVAVLTIVGAVLSFLAGEAPLGIGIGILAAASVVEVAKAAKTIAAAARNS